MPEAPALDRLSALFERFRVRASLFHAGPLCGVTRFDARPGRGFMHVMRRGEMTVRHAEGGLPRELAVREPSLLFYPRPLAHDFHNAPTEGADFVCATLDFDQGEAHPLVQALPALHERPGEPWPLERMAAAAGMSRSRFAQAFRTEVGQTPADYLARWRLALARRQAGEAAGRGAGLRQCLGLQPRVCAACRLLSARLAAGPGRVK